MGPEQRINDTQRDCPMTDQRKQQLTDGPTFVLNNEDGRRVSVIIEQSGENYSAFARIDQDEEVLGELSAIANSEEVAIQGLGHGVWEMYSESRERMHRTGRVPRHLRFFKTDSF